MTWRLHVLGSSSTRTPEGDSTASLALSNGDQVILIDAGGNLPARLERANLDPARITNVIITHSHPDHTYGLPFLSHSFYHDHGRVTCHSTSEAIPRLRKSLEAYDLQEPNRYLRVAFNEITIDEIQAVDVAESLDVRTVPNDHSREGFGLRIATNNRSLVYSGDTQPCQSIEEAAEDADILVHDCQGLHGYKRYFEGSHTSALELARMAERLGVDLLVPFHHNLIELPGGWNEIGEEIRRHYNGTIVYPNQGMGFIL